MTREELKSYVRNKAKEFDEQGLAEALLDEDANQAMWAVQQDLIPYNVKSFNKTYLADGRYFATPSDMLASPNAIADIMAGAGVKAFATLTIGDPGDTMTITAKEPGTAWNGWVITLDDTGTLGTPTINFAAKTVLLGINGGTSTNTQIINALNNNAVFAEFFTATTNNGAGVSGSQDYEFTLADGTGSGFLACSEMSVKDRNRILTDTYSKPTATQPKYLRHGNSTGAQYIEIFPDTMLYAKVYYYYKFAAMTLDADVLPIPDEYREVYLLKLLTKVYETLNRMAQEQDKKVDFAKKKQEYEKNYIDTLNNTMVQNKKIDSNDSQS